MTTGPLWQQAAAYAARVHCSQIRKDGCTPYVSHPVRVALTVACEFDERDEEILAAALLHDAIEDCGTDYDDILETFGPRVANLVACVSKDMRMIEHEREEAYDRQLAAGPWEARLIKLADVFDNLSDAVCEHRHVAAFIEKVERALHLTRNDPELTRASGIVRKALEDARNGTDPE